jgi:hypothetical protein
MRDTDAWEPTFQDVVERRYDFGRLHRISTGVDVGILPFSMLVCFDGTLALPLTGPPDPDKALSIFNRTLSEMLIGGLYCEAMSPDDLCQATSKTEPLPTPKTEPPRGGLWAR